MASNTFSITITAVDQATATVRAVNNAFKAMAKPVTAAGASLKGVAKATGLDQLAKRVMVVGKSAADTAAQIAKIVPPLATVAGFASIAGLAALATSWTRMGQEVTQTSLAIGMSTDELQSWRGAAKMLGIDAGAATGALGSMGDTLQGAVMGRSPEALAAMTALGIRFKRTATGAVDVQSALMDLAGAMPRLNPQAQRVAAGMFGVTSLLPLLRQGPAALKRYQDEVARSGAIATPAQLKAAADLQQSLNLLHLKFAGLGNVIAERLAPVVGPLADKFMHWADANQAVIASRVAEFANKVADAVQRVDWKKVADGVNAFAGAVNAVVGVLGGWGNALILVAGIMNAQTLVACFKLIGGMGSLILKAGEVAFALGSQLALAAASAAEAVGAEGLSAAFLSFGAVLEATPVGWILTAIAAIGVAGYLLITHWKQVTSFFAGVWKKIAPAAPFLPIIGQIKMLIDFAQVAARVIGGLFHHGPKPAAVKPPASPAGARAPAAAPGQAPVAAPRRPVPALRPSPAALSQAPVAVRLAAPIPPSPMAEPNRPETFPTARPGAPQVAPQVATATVSGVPALLAAHHAAAARVSAHIDGAGGKSMMLLVRVADTVRTSSVELHKGVVLAGATTAREVNKAGLTLSAQLEQLRDIANTLANPGDAGASGVAGLAGAIGSLVTRGGRAIGHVLPDVPQIFAKGIGAFFGRIEHQESRGRQFNRFGQVLTSAAGAIGAMQMLPATAAMAAARMGVAWDAQRFRTDANYNRTLGQGELKHLLARYSGDQTLAAAAYNAGPGNVDKWLRTIGDPRSGRISDRDFQSRIPFAETRNYVAMTAGSDILSKPAPGAAGQAAQAQVDVHFKNAPHGTTAKVTAGPGTKTTAKIAHAMPVTG